MAFKVGDVVECLTGFVGYYTIGKLYTVSRDCPDGSLYLYVNPDDRGLECCWETRYFRAWNSPTNLNSNDLGKTEVEQYVEEHYKSAEQERKERIWKALQGAAKQ